MSKVAIVHHLRDRAKGLKANFITTKNNHKVPEVIANRIEFLKETKQLDIIGLTDELNGILELAMETKRVAKKPALKVVPKDNLPKFCAEFLEFLETGDYSSLAPTGKMTPEMYKKTKDYIFCNIKKIAGKTVQASFISNPLKRCDGILADGLEIGLGNAIILRTGLICDTLLFNDEESIDFIDRSRTFNNLAGRSKVL